MRKGSCVIAQYTRGVRITFIIFYCYCQVITSNPKELLVLPIASTVSISRSATFMSAIAT